MKNNNTEYRRLIVANKNYIAKRLGMFGTPKVSRMKHNTITITDRLQTAGMSVLVEKQTNPNRTSYTIKAWRDGSSEITADGNKRGSYTQTNIDDNPNNILNAIEYSLNIYA